MSKVSLIPWGYHSIARSLHHSIYLVIQGRRPAPEGARMKAPDGKAGHAGRCAHKMRTAHHPQFRGSIPDFLRPVADDKERSKL